MKAYVNVTTKYCCYLDEEQERLIRDFAHMNNLTLKLSIQKLQCIGGGDLHLFKDYDELFTSAYDVVEVVE